MSAVMTREEVMKIDLKELYQMLNEDYFEGRAPRVHGVLLRWSTRMRTWVGRARWNWHWRRRERYEIALAVDYHRIKGYGEIIETMIHEMAHIVTRAGDADEKFQRELIRLNSSRYAGGSPLRKVHPKGASRWRHEYGCECGAKVVRKRWERRRGVKCKECGGMMVLGRSWWVE